MTEDEAKTKWCPFIRFIQGNEQYHPMSSRAGLVLPHSADEACENETRCIGSACMAWRPTRPALVRNRPERLSDDTPAEELALSQRTINVIGRMDLRTVGDIRRTSDLTFLRVEGCGRRSVNELRDLTGPHAASAQPSAVTPTGYCGLAGAPA